MDPQKRKNKKLEKLYRIVKALCIECDRKQLRRLRKHEKGVYKILYKKCRSLISLNVDAKTPGKQVFFVTRGDPCRVRTVDTYGSCFVFSKDENGVPIFKRPLDSTDVDTQTLDAYYYFCSETSQYIKLLSYVAQEGVDIKLAKHRVPLGKPKSRAKRIKKLRRAIMINLLADDRKKKRTLDDSSCETYPSQKKKKQKATQENDISVAIDRGEVTTTDEEEEDQSIPCDDSVIVEDDDEDIASTNSSESYVPDADENADCDEGADDDEEEDAGDDDDTLTSNDEESSVINDQLGSISCSESSGDDDANGDDSSSSESDVV
jgi:hypothetical protein